MVSLISLVILVVAGIILINLGLKTWILTKADNNSYYSPQLMCAEVKNTDGTVLPQDPNCNNPEYQAKQLAEEKERKTAQKQQDAAQALAMIIVASPVFYYHWKLARKEA